MKPFSNKLSDPAAWGQIKEKIVHTFCEHPHAAGETYWQHLRFTLGMSSRFLYCWLALLIHGIFPFLFTRTGSCQIEKMHGIMKERVAREEPPKLDLAS